MELKYIQAAALGLIVLVVIILELKLAKAKTLCDSCKFQVGRERTGTRGKSCNIWGGPACMYECRTYFKKD